MSNHRQMLSLYGASKGKCRSAVVPADLCKASFAWLAMLHAVSGRTGAWILFLVQPQPAGRGVKNMCGLEQKRGYSRGMPERQGCVPRMALHRRSDRRYWVCSSARGGLWEMRQTRKATARAGNSRMGTRKRLSFLTAVNHAMRVGGKY